MTIFEAQVILGIDPDAPRGEFITLSDLRDMKKRIETERESLSGNAKRRKTIELKACEKLIAWLEPKW
jgi:hypothetical protein